MRAHSQYKHKGTLDIGIEILKIQYRGPKSIKVKGTIFNRHNKIVYYTGTFSIMRDEFYLWEYVK